MASKRNSSKSETPDEKTFGVVLIAFGDVAYYYMAYNLAFSIKFYSPDVPIAIQVADLRKFEAALSAEKRSYFDEIIEFHYEGSPADVKLNIDGFCVYDRSLYLDVDTFCVKDIAPLFEELKGKDYVFHNNNADNLWAKQETIRQHYGIEEKTELYSVNSSVQYIERGEKSFEVFEKARELFSNPIPLGSLKNKWGKTQPDELYLNVALSVLNHDTYFKNPPVFFATRPSIQPNEVQYEYYFLSYFGPRGHTPPTYTNWIDRRLHNMHLEKCQRHTNNSQIPNLLKSKFANR